MFILSQILWIAAATKLRSRRTLRGRRIPRDAVGGPALTHPHPTSFFLCPRTCHIQRGLASATSAAPPAPVLRLARTPAVPLFRARTTICRREIKRQRAGPLLHARQAILHREIDLCHPPATFVVAPPSSRRRHGFRPRALPRGLLNFRGSPLSCPRGNRTSQGAACGTSV
jgi:hypothetical protein